MRAACSRDELDQFRIHRLMEEWPEQADPPITRIRHTRGGERAVGRVVLRTARCRVQADAVVILLLKRLKDETALKITCLNYT